METYGSGLAFIELKTSCYARTSILKSMILKFQLYIETMIAKHKSLIF